MHRATVTRQHRNCIQPIIAYPVPLFRRRRRITKIASSSSKNYSLTAQARRVRLASSSRKTGKVAGRVHPVMGSTMCAVPPTPTTSSTQRYYLVVSLPFEP